MELDFDKMNGLVPAIIQDNETRKVLMLGFMSNFFQPNKEPSLDERRRERQFPSRRFYQGRL